MNLLDWVSSMWPVSFFSMVVAGLLAALGVVVWMLVRPGRSRVTGVTGEFGVDTRPPETVAARARELMDDAEVALLNLLALAARDRFLVLAKMPLTRLIRLQVRDDFDAEVVAKSIRSITVDFVLLHPGTRRAAKVVFVQKPGDESSSWSVRYPWLDTLFRDAEIEVIRLDPMAWHDMEKLTEVLGITDEA